MTREYKVGAHVIYHDSFGIPHDALVTIWWGATDVPSYQSPTGEPGCNVVYVSGDERKGDSCGRQIERNTSVVHRSFQPAHGHFWRWPDE